MSSLFTLTRDDHQRIIDAERSLHDALALMDQLEGCGTDCQQIKELATALLDRLAKIRTTFKPEKARR